MAHFHKWHKFAEENQSFTAARKPTNKINSSVSYYETRSSPPVASRFFSPIHPPTLLLPPPPSALCFRDIMIASLRSEQASLLCLVVWQREQVWHQFPHGSPSQAFRVDSSLATHSLWRRPVPVRRSHRKIRWPPFFTPIHMRRTGLSHQLLKKTASKRGGSRERRVESRTGSLHHVGRCTAVWVTFSWILTAGVNRSH